MIHSLIIDGHRLNRDEIENLIYKAALGKTDEYIARAYYLDGLQHGEIAADLGDVLNKNIDRSTVSRRLKRIKSILNV